MNFYQAPASTFPRRLGDLTKALSLRVVKVVGDVVATSCHLHLRERGGRE
jgi:hypothetical protein